MSCGGNGKSIASGEPWVLNDDNYDSPTFKQPSECDEGYLARAGNPEKDLSGGAVEKDKILNVSIPVTMDLLVTTQMKLSPGSKRAKRWTSSGSIPGIVFDTATGKFDGTVSFEGRYTTTITAYDESDQVIDSKSYQLVAQKATADDGIRFIHPMPGSVITSRCTASVDGTKIWDDPKRGRPHKGIDLAYVGGKIGNVRAAASGEVIRAVSDESSQGYGNVVYIGHRNTAGKKICITVYGHLSKVAVKVGQQVSAGDFIGVEGNTGASAGAHLHFEIRSPEFASSNQAAAVYDPAAFIKGQVLFDDVSSRIALDQGKDPNPGNPMVNNISSQDNADTVAITPAMVDNKCSGYQEEPGNPGPGAQINYVTNTISGDVWKDAFTFVMKEEVGSWFNPYDPETQKGLIGTSPQRKKCGYVEDTGGETKFGIAKRFNSSTNITALTLPEAEQIYFEKYWKANKCDRLPKSLASIHFNACVNPGPSFARNALLKVLNVSSESAAIDKANRTAPSDIEPIAKRYLNEIRNYYMDLAKSNPSKYGKYLNGWLARVEHASNLL